MPLNIRVTGADEYGTYLKVLVCGDPGSGKTRFSSTWPNPLLVSVNANLMSVADRQMTYVPVNSSGDLLQLRHALDNPPEVRERLIGKPVDSVIIDTIDHFQQILGAERRRDEKKDSLGGADWGWLGDEMRAIVRGWRNLPLHVAFLCHLKVTEDQETQRVYLRPSLQGAMGDEIAGYVDIAMAFKAVTTLEVAADGQTSQRVVHRYAQTYPDLQLPWVRDNSHNLPPEFEIDFDTDFERLHSAVFGGVNLAASVVVGPLEEAAIAETRPAVAAPPVKAVSKSATKPIKAASRVAPTPPKAAPPKADAGFDRAPARQVSDAEAVTAGDPKDKVGLSPAAEAMPIIHPALQPTAEVELDEEFSEPPGEEALANELAAELTNPAATNGAAPAVSTPCESCGGAIESEDQLDLSNLRFRKPLCRNCFIAAKTPAGVK